MRVPIKFSVPPLRALSFAWSDALITVPQRFLPQGLKCTMTLPLGFFQWPSSGVCANAIAGRAAAQARVIAKRIAFIAGSIGLICGKNPPIELLPDEPGQLWEQ